jgi:UDP-N-acetyl-D-mannosaminuronate dehydrogenase
VNDAMPEYVVGLLESLGGDLAGRRVAVLGLAYRGGVKESAFSGVFGCVEALRRRGALPVVHDPLYSDDEIRAFGFEPYHFGEPVDAAVLQADHSEYLEIGPRQLPGVAAILDGRNVLDHARWRADGVACETLGRFALR